MENSQKALLIAGAILLSILIISAGMYIYSISSSSVNISAIDELSIKTANSEFDLYEGRQKGTTVINLLNKVIEYNRICPSDADYSMGVCSKDDRILKNTSGVLREALEQSTTRTYGVIQEVNIKKIQKLILKSQYYNIWFDYNKLNGYIYIVHIDPPN